LWIEETEQKLPADLVPRRLKPSVNPHHQVQLCCTLPVADRSASSPHLPRDRSLVDRIHSPERPEPAPPANTTHLNPGQELAVVLSAWLSDGLPLPESAESKCQRVRVAREAAGLGTDSVRSVIEAEFEGRTSPQQLSSGECDRLVAMLEVVRRSA
jgi:hypothetical protein